MTTDIHVSNPDSFREFHPDVSFFDDGSFVVVWYPGQAQIFDRSGNELGDQIDINPEAAAGKVKAGYPQVFTHPIENGRKSFSVVFTEGFGVSYDIAVSHFEASDTGGKSNPDDWKAVRVGPRFAVNAGASMQPRIYSPGHQKYNNAVQLNDTDILVTWTDDPSNLKGRQVYGRRIRWDGSTRRYEHLGAEFKIDNGRLGTSPAPLADGGYVIVYNSPGTDLQVKRYNADGHEIGFLDGFGTGGGYQLRNRKKVSAATSVQNITVDRVTMLNNGDLVFTWAEQSPTGDIDVVMQRYVWTPPDPATGTPGHFEPAAIETVHQSSIGTQQDASVVPLRDGGYAIIWSSTPQPGHPDGGSGLDIFGQRFAADGTRLKLDGSIGVEEFRFNSETTGKQFSPKIDVDDQGRIVAVWVGTNTPYVDASGKTGVSDGGGDIFATIITPVYDDDPQAHDCDHSDNIMVGGSGGDRAHGLGGHDTLQGNGGADMLFGDAGNDSLTGGEGDDRLHGGGGIGATDPTPGGSGIGVGGHDTLDGGAGRDVLIGGLGHDDLSGGEGDDILYGDGTGPGGSGDAGDTGTAGTGAGGRQDPVAAATGVAARTGNDVIRPGDGNDTVVCGPGDDTVIFGAGKDRVDGGAGSDTAIFSGARGDYRIRSDGSFVWVDGPQGLKRLKNIETLRFRGDNQKVDLRTLAVTETGSTGDDVIGGLAAGDVLSGDLGNDTLSGLGGNDTLSGGAGNDLLVGGTGIDSLVGGAGDDIVAIDGSIGDFAIEDKAGVVTVRSRADGAVVDIMTGVEFLRFTHDGKGSVARAAIGTAAADSLTGGGGDDTLYGQDGDDWLVGGGGVDRFVGGAGTDTAVLAGRSGDHFIRHDGRQTRVYDIRTGNAVAVLEDIETVRFTGDRQSVSVAAALRPPVARPVLMTGAGTSLETRLASPPAAATPWVFELVTGSPDGAVSLSKSGALVFDPADGFAGETRFVVRMTDPASGAVTMETLTVQVQATASPPTGGEFHANVNKTGADERRPAIRALPNGMMVASWLAGSSTRNEGAQLLDSSGRAIGSSFRVRQGRHAWIETEIVSAVPGRPVRIAVGYTGNPTYGDYDTYVQLFDVHGTPQTNTAGIGNAYVVPVGGAVRVHDSSAAIQKYNRLTALSDGRLVATWLEAPTNVRTGSIKARILSVNPTTGALETASAEITVGRGTAIPDVTALPDGGFIIARATSNALLGVRYDANGRERALDGVGSTGAFRIASSSRAPLSRQGGYGSHLATLADGSLVVTFAATDRSLGDASAAGIQGVIYRWSRSGGTGVLTAGTPFAVNTVTAGDQQDPSVLALPDGGFLVAWGSPRDADGSYGIYGQRFDSTGAKVGLDGTPSGGTPGGTEFRISRTVTGHQQAPRLDLTADGHVVLVWVSQNQPDPDTGLVDRSDGIFGTFLALKGVTPGMVGGPIAGTDSNDVIVFTGPRAASLTGGAGDDQLSAGGRNDSLDGGTGNDTLAGGAGNDTLDGGAGTDSLNGGDGNDRYLFGRGDAADVVQDSGGTDRIDFSAGIGHDQLWFERTGTDLTISVIGTTDSLTVAGWFGTANPTPIETITVASGHDVTAGQINNLVNAMAAFATPGSNTGDLSGYAPSLQNQVDTLWGA